MKQKLITLFLIALCGSIKAQDAINNNGNLQIHTGSSITGFGSFTNASSAVLVNNGSLYIRGNLSNDQSSMSAGSGTLYLDGTSAQTVNGSQAFRTNNLETNNSAGFTLNNNLSVSGIHTFTSGMIASSSTPNYLVYEAGSSHTGSNDSRHSTGWVKKNGNTGFTFPVGDATYQRTAAISGLSASSEINCKYFTPTTNIYNLASPLVQVKANEYWQIDKVSGGTAQITLNWDHAKVPMDNIMLADILVAHYTGGNWTDAGGGTTATGNVTTTGSVTSSSVNTFSPFTLGYKSFPVPLKLVSFTAERRSGTSYLRWITENEENVDYFDVQRSYDANNFSSIGKVAARNSGSREHYHFEDQSPLRGFAWYRIRSVDIDGKFSHSRIVVVSETDLQSTSFVVLNPARTAITVFNKTGQEGLFDYRLFNSGGLMVTKGTVNMSSNGGAVLPLPLETASGIYILELRNDKTQFRQKVMVEK
ncbi:MAG: T9SS type A sorting domain-containing protein [Chitinophagaceae bacterium]|nr:T9SS type A sorting domain-containing protein [Chitinophagaceae bacterium]